MTIVAIHLIFLASFVAGLYILRRNDEVGKERLRVIDHIFGGLGALLNNVDPESDRFDVDFEFVLRTKFEWLTRFQKIAYWEMVFSLRPVDSFFQDLDADIVATCAGLM